MAYADDKPKVKEYKSGDERDAELEKRYDYDRIGYKSTLAFVTHYRAELADAFFDWFRENQYPGGEKPEEGLVRWEHVRFGSALDPCPHAALLFVVVQKIRGLWGKPVGKAEKVDRQRVDKFVDAVEKLAQAHGFGLTRPRNEQRSREYTERLAELYRKPFKDPEDAEPVAAGKSPCRPQERQPGEEG